MQNDEKLRKRVLSQVAQVGDCWIWTGSMDIPAPKSRLVKLAGDFKHRVIKYPQPTMKYKGKRSQPFRHFFPGLSPKVRLTKICGTKQCQNPEHRRLPLEHLMRNHEYDLSIDTPEELQDFVFPWASLDEIKAVRKKVFG